MENLTLDEAFEQFKEAFPSLAVEYKPVKIEGKYLILGWTDGDESALTRYDLARKCLEF